MTALGNKSVEELRELFITMTGTPSGEGQKLPTLKLTGYVHGDTGTKIEDAFEAKIPKAVRNSKNLKVEESGNVSICVVADEIAIMNLRFKWESQALEEDIRLMGFLGLRVDVRRPGDPVTSGPACGVRHEP